MCSWQNIRVSGKTYVSCSRQSILVPSKSIRISGKTYVFLEKAYVFQAKRTYFRQKHTCSRQTIHVSGKTYMFQAKAYAFHAKHTCSRQSIRIPGKTYVFQAKHTEESPGRKVYREFTRQYVLPEKIDPLTLNSTLTADGVLSIEGPAPAAVEAPKERILPIKQLL